ncbi:MAG: hypothetical protein H6619_06845 [Deltaproteobacteria bacterium]|nr:hypothetical protein [Deltaproteobacteria bacterium]
MCLKIKLLQVLCLTALVASVGMVSSVHADGEEALNAERASMKPKFANKGTGIEEASGETLATAMGYYARSRAHLIEAIRAFDKARRLARPDVVLDTEEFRSTLSARAEDLERVLAPQQRVTRGGIKLEGDSTLLNVTNK